MDIVKDPRVDWLGLKWIFIGISLVLMAIGAGSLLLKGLNLGVDFTGGTLAYVKFREAPALDKIRAALLDAGLPAQEVTRFDDPSKNEVQIRMSQVSNEEAQQLGDESDRIMASLLTGFDSQDASAGKSDLNNISKVDLAESLQKLDPDKVGTGRSETPAASTEESQNPETAPVEEPVTGAEGGGVTPELERHYAPIATRIVDFRTSQGGLFKDTAELSQLQLSPAVTTALNEQFYLGSFSVLSVESVGPKVGRELQRRAQMAVLFSLLGMLAYIAFRFRPIYGLAAILALFHDVFITVGFFSISSKEISLTVVAALLTLVGYSINDTIVVFDRVRENSRLMRRQSVGEIINASINQTLNRTILTSGMTFLAVMALYLFGGQVLNGFSFTLVVGIIVGTYSSIAIASPIVLWWQQQIDRRKAGA